MKKFVAYMLTFGITVLGTMAFVNYAIDPLHLYSTTFIDKMMEGIRRGANVEVETSIDDRIYKLKLAELYRGHNYDYLALGTSHIMFLSEDAMDGATLLNLGVGGGKNEDMLAFYQICKDNDIHYKNVIISVDPGLLNSNDDSRRWESIRPFFNKFLRKETDKVPNWNLVRNLFSLSYFRIAIEDELIKRIQGKSEMSYVNTVINEEATWRVDGSMYPEKDFCERSQILIDGDAMTWTCSFFTDFYKMSEKRVALFERLIDALKADEVNIIFFCSPTHPLFHKRIMALKGVTASMKYFEKYAEENDIPIIGKYDPMDLGFDNTHFYDASHVRKEYIDSLFLPFMKEHHIHPSYHSISDD